MILEHKYPVCEFDTDTNAVIKATDFLQPSLPARCVITFFRKELLRFVEEKELPVIGWLHSEVVDHAIYEYETKGEKICITMPFSTAPGAAVTIEELRAMGCEKFVICGAAGCICEGISVGQLILPTAAVRDEGTSYHYLEPAREVSCHKGALKSVKDGLKEMGIPYMEGKTWTSDAIYRETPDMVSRRRSEGCITAEMESAAFFAVSKYYRLPLAQLLYAGDDVSGTKWDSRNWNNQKSVRENLIHVSARLVMLL